MIPLTYILYMALMTYKYKSVQCFIEPCSMSLLRHCITQSRSIELMQDWKIYCGVENSTMDEGILFVISL